MSTLRLPIGQVFVLLLVACLLHGRLDAQWSPDPSANLQVCDVTGEQVIPKIVNTSDGGTYVCWFDSRNGEYAVYLQRLDAMGVKQWAPDGLLISSHPQNTWLVDYDMDVDQNDNAVIVFTDIRNGGDFNPFAYKIGPDGTFLWGPDGVTLSGAFSVFQAAPCVKVTSDGGAVFTWFFGTDTSKVAMQRLSAGGDKEWGEQPVLLSGGAGEQLSNPSLVASDSGSVILFWSGYMGSFLNPQNYHLYTQRFDREGAPVWSAAPDTVYGLGRVPGFFVPKIVSDGQGGALYGWHDDRNSTNLSTSFVQHFTRDGAALFPVNGSAVSTLSGRNHFDVSMSFDPVTGETFAAWLETNDLQTLMGMYGQKFSADGTRQWSDQGLPLIPLSGNAQGYITVSAVDSSALVWWVDLFTGGVDNAVRGMRLDRSGGRMWGDSVRTVSSAPDEKLHMVVTYDPRGVTKLAWGDRRNDACGIYAQTVWLDGSLGNPPTSVADPGAGPQGFVLRQCYPNPFNPSTRIEYTIPGRGGTLHATSLHVFDVLGRHVATLVDGMESTGEKTVQCDATNLPSGVYFYTLTVDGQRATRSMVVMK